MTEHLIKGTSTKMSSFLDFSLKSEKYFYAIKISIFDIFDMDFSSMLQC